MSVAKKSKKSHCPSHNKKLPSPSQKHRSTRYLTRL